MVLLNPDLFFRAVAQASRRVVLKPNLLLNIVDVGENDPFGRPCGYRFPEEF